MYLEYVSSFEELESITVYVIVFGADLINHSIQPLTVVCQPIKHKTAKMLERQIDLTQWVMACYLRSF